MNQTVRLDKLLAGSGLYTRSQAQAAVRAGLVTVDGRCARKPEEKVSRESAVLAEGRVVDTAEFVYYMMNKPAGYISATEDGAWPAVTDLLPKHLQNRGVFPAGRLDADVTGLLLLTDDGAFAHRITAPRSVLPKTYEIWTGGPLGPADAEALTAGVTMADGTVYRPAKLELDGEDPCHGWVTVTEGKFHEVKNLIASRGRRVERMCRVSIGGLALDRSLAPGQFRPLTDAELAACLGA